MKQLTYSIVFIVFTYASWFAATQGSELGPDKGLTFWYVMASTFAAVVALGALFNVFKGDL